MISCKLKNNMREHNYTKFESQFCRMQISETLETIANLNKICNESSRLNLIH